MKLYEIKLPAKFIFAVMVIIGLIFLFGSFGTVDTGYRGVVLHLQNPTGEVKEQGFYTKKPIVESVVDMNVQIQKEEATDSAASRDLQDVTAVIALNYHLDPKAVGSIYQEFRRNYSARYIQPALHESVKSSTAQFTAEELITHRSDVKQAIAASLREKLTPKGIIVDDINIINFAFSQSFNEAIEAKVTAEQNALASKNKLEQVKYEAQQSIEKAKGEAESIRIQSQALKEQPQFIELKAVEQWNGILPQYMIPGGSVPFLNLGK